MDKFIQNSQISDEDVSLFNGVRITNSLIGKKTVVGDFSRVTDSKLLGFNRVDRNSLVYFSNFEEFSYLGSNSVVMHSDIGKFCSLSWGITIGPANHDYDYITSHDFLYNDFYKIKPENEQPIYDRFNERTKIGNDVWIGTNSTILNGLSIGNGVVVGANAIVTKDIPPYAIVVGNPGKIVGYRFSDDIISQLLELEWWHLPRETISENFQLFKSKNIKDLIQKLKILKS